MKAIVVSKKTGQPEIIDAPDEEKTLILADVPDKDKKDLTDSQLEV